MGWLSQFAWPISPPLGGVGLLARAFPMGCDVVAAGKQLESRNGVSSLGFERVLAIPAILGRGGVIMDFLPSKAAPTD